MNESRNIPKQKEKTRERSPFGVKNVITLLLIVFIIFSLAFLGYKEIGKGEFTGPQTVKQADSSNQAHDSKVIAYYLHGTFRCPTCLTIEQYSREAIEFYFPDQLREGKLVFIVKNFDELENRHFIKDYHLYSQSLVVVLVQDGEQVKWKNLEEIWNLVNSRYQFYEYVKQEIEEYLGEVP